MKANRVLPQIEKSERKNSVNISFIHYWRSALGWKPDRSKVFPSKNRYFKNHTIILLVIALILLSSFSCFATKNFDTPLAVSSPSEKIQVVVSMSDINEIIYSIIFNNKVLLSESHLSLRLRGGDFSKSLEITNVRRETHDETYDLVVGKSKHVRNHYNEAVISLQEKSGQRRKLDVIFRVYNDGVAFHYSFPEQSALRDFEILAEHSEFRFLENYICWALELKGFTTNYEDVFGQKTIGAIEPDTLVGLPLTVEIDDGPFLAITEANLRDYAGMYLEAIDGEEYALRSSLSPLPNEDGVCVKGSPPHRSPWRVIMIGEKPGDLIESNIIINLNEPCAISDPSWIKPGKVAWPWWSARTVTDVDFEGGMNTSTMKHYIDFAAEFKLEYLLIDAKWYGAHKDPAQDITTTIPEIDMPHILGYAKERNVDVILWLNWQNTRDQMDRAFPLYEKWGVKGVKVDYMNRDDQEMVDFYHQVVKKAAEHHLLVDFHGSYKPTGMRRTYPNCLTREGVLGLEHTKWSTRVTPEHNVTIPFTRMLAGPMDYTPGAFHNVTETQFRAQYESPMAMGTRCHHLAMFVVYESPLQMCSDYPGAYRGQPGAELLKVVPASWDATRVLAGKIGDYIAVARKHGDEWFIGAMTDWEPRSLKLSLKFLDDREYSALIYADGTEAKEIPSSITQKTIKVRGVDSLSAAMAPGGGYVVHLTPIADD